MGQSASWQKIFCLEAAFGGRFRKSPSQAALACVAQMGAVGVMRSKGTDREWSFPRTVMMQPVRVHSYTCHFFPPASIHFLASSLSGV